MFIVPLTSSITPMERTMGANAVKQTEQEDGEATFLDVFKSLVDNVKETDAQVQQDAIDLMLGEIDDLAQVQVNLEKAATAVDLLVTVKNKAVDAYNEIMRMNV
ncbi:MAG: flagellar hook-basal body complex protein FliE [Ruminiclostridium sp.]|nr:flagellar hook-basal body complex protein FliE [Ruminiclostridium sp.]